MENDNITYSLDEYNGNDDMNNIELEKLLNDFENIKNDFDNTDDDELYSEMINYDSNYNVKQLLLICEYYSLTKDVKVNKMKKQDIIEQILLFENNIENIEIVFKRKELWSYMNELKKDKMMKKFLIWN